MYVLYVHSTVCILYMNILIHVQDLVLHVHSLNSHSNPTRKVFYSSFFTYGKLRYREIVQLWRITQLVSGRTGVASKTGDRVLDCVPGRSSSCYTGSPALCSFYHSICISSVLRKASELSGKVKLGLKRKYIW